jgi:quercetin 2,3-dioxygenase
MASRSGDHGGAGSTSARRERRIDRVHAIQVVGGNEQVDNKAVIFPRGDFALLDPFIALSEDWFSAPGFDWHPHRGIETVTTVLDGALEHGDNHGNVGVLEPGSAQWMTAGEGIIHREFAYRNEYAHTLQLWLNLPASKKLAHARYQDLSAGSMASVVGHGTRVEVVSGRMGGAVGPADNHWPITGLHVTMEPGRSVSLDLPGADRAFLYVMAGEVGVGGRETRLKASQVGWTDPVGAGPSTLELIAPEGDEEVRVLLYSGEPIGESVVAYGPFVMNTREEIEQAFRDYHAGRFGAVPALDRAVRA